MLEELKLSVLEANLELPQYDLVKFTWGNVSAIDRDSGLVVIKASGVPYEEMRAEHMVVIDLEGRVVEGCYRPSSDAPTHLELYKAWRSIGGIVHTHSRYATAFAQAGHPIPCYGTTHADYFYGDVPCTRQLDEHEVSEAYEKNTACPIIESFADKDPLAVPGVVVKNHGVFTWGKDANAAVYHAVVLEEVAHMAILSQLVDADVQAVPCFLQDKHYQRKHGANAYYGQA